MTTPTPQTCIVCDDVIVLREQIKSLQSWQTIAESDLRRFRDLAAKVDLLVALTTGGGLLSLITLAAVLFKVAP